MRKGKGRGARLSFMGHALMENGNGLLMLVDLLDRLGLVKIVTGLVGHCECGWFRRGSEPQRVRATGRVGGEHRQDCRLRLNAATGVVAGAEGSTLAAARGGREHSR